MGKEMLYLLVDTWKRAKDRQFVARCGIIKKQYYPVSEC